LQTKLNYSEEKKQLARSTYHTKNYDDIMKASKRLFTDARKEHATWWKKQVKDAEAMEEALKSAPQTNFDVNGDGSTDVCTPFLLGLRCSIKLTDKAQASTSHKRPIARMFSLGVSLPSSKQYPNSSPYLIKTC
jgi:hypothetical protein